MGLIWMGVNFCEKNMENTDQIGMGIAIAIGFVFLIIFLGGAAWGFWAQAPLRKRIRKTKPMAMPTP